jgi:hypothetical protein
MSSGICCVCNEEDEKCITCPNCNKLFCDLCNIVYEGVCCTITFEPCSICRKETTCTKCKECDNMICRTCVIEINESISITCMDNNKRGLCCKWNCCEDCITNESLINCCFCDTLMYLYCDNTYTITDNGGRSLLYMCYKCIPTNARRKIVNLEKEIKNFKIEKMLVKYIPNVLVNTIIPYTSVIIKC